MSPVFCAGGTVLVTGLRFDLARVLDAYARVLDTFSEARPGGFEVMTRDPSRVSHAWPGPGREKALAFWRAAAGTYEAVDEPLIHASGGLVIKAYLLGKTWLVHDPASDRLLTPTRGDLSELDPSPMLCFYGAMRDGEPDMHALLDDREIAAARGAIEGPLSGLGLAWHEVPLVRNETTGETLGVGFATFPHAVYGDGVGPIRVRCITTDGAFVAKNILSE